MVVSHTLEGQRIPAEHLSWAPIKVAQLHELTLKVLLPIREMVYSESLLQIMERHYNNPPVDFHAQRFLGVR